LFCKYEAITKNNVAIDPGTIFGLLWCNRPTFVVAKESKTKFYNVLRESEKL
jgi:hypothetical protein